MQKQALTAAAILCLVGGVSGPDAVAKDQIPWSHLLTIADQTMQIPAFGSPLRTFTPVTSENLAKELPDDRFVADRFPPARLVFPDGSQETEPSGTHTVVRVLSVQSVLKAYALPNADAPRKSGTENPRTPLSRTLEGGIDLLDDRLLFNQRRVTDWDK